VNERKERELLKKVPTRKLLASVKKDLKQQIRESRYARKAKKR
jgi:hypothetical protein